MIPECIFGWRLQGFPDLFSRCWYSSELARLSRNGRLEELSECVGAPWENLERRFTELISRFARLLYLEFEYCAGFRGKVRLNAFRP